MGKTIKKIDRPYLPSESGKPQSYDSDDIDEEKVCPEDEKKAQDKRELNRKRQ